MASERWLIGLFGCALCACSGSETANGGVGGAAGAGGLGGASGTGGAVVDLFVQAPHCGMNLPRFSAQGTVEGVAVDDTRTTGFTGGYSNGTMGNFATPASGSTAGPDQITMSFDWNMTLAFGQYAPIVSGTFTLPQTQSGQTYCIVAGEVGFPGNTSSEAGVFKFKITSAARGTDCTGAPTAIPIDLRGCYD